MPTKSATRAYSFIILVCGIICLSPVKAQKKNDLVYKHGGFGLFSKRFYLNDVKITRREVAQLLEKENKEAYKVFKSAKTNTIAGALIMIPSSALLVFGTLSYIFRDSDHVEEQPGLLIGGAVGVTGSVILLIIGNNKFKKAAAIYSHASSSIRKSHLDFGLTRSGRIGLTVSL